MSLVEILRKDALDATKNSQSDRVDILKMAIASIKNEEISLGKELNDEQAIAVVRKEIKKIKDSITEYEKMGREDLLNKEKSQFEILNSYVPQLMSEEDVKKVVEAKVKELGAKGLQDMGKVIGSVMQELRGKADGSVVKEVVQASLSE